MTHRSNQAVASQDQAAPQPPEDPSTARRLLIGWTTALAALAISSGVLAGGLWLARLSIAEVLIGAVLADRGVVADFDVAELDFNHASIAALRIGAENAPDASAGVLEARWRWNGLLPALEEIRVQDPLLRLRLDTAGHVSAGTLDQMRGTPSAQRMRLPTLRLTIENGRAVIEAPFGALNAEFHSEGVLGEDFQAVARIDETSLANGAYALDGGAAELTAMSREGALAFRLDARLTALTWNDVEASGGALRMLARAPLDLSRYEGEGALRIASLTAPQVSTRQIDLAFGGEAIAREDGLPPQLWQARVRVRAPELALSSNRFTHMRLDASGEGRDGDGNGEWTLSAQRFDGLAMSSARPSASGAFTLNLNNGVSANGDARLILAQTRMDGEAQQRLRQVFPDLPQAPIGPTFAQAEAALDRAADRFDLTIPLSFETENNNVLLRVSAPIQARATSGAVLRVAPLRQDIPALELRWPSLNVQGAVAINLAGGGAPHAALLLDRYSWSREAAFDTEGTLSLTSWRAQGASIEADELHVGATITPEGNGSAEIRGPARITGPLGDGEMRDLVTDLNLGISWGNGWRITPEEGCLPVRIGGLDAAGLSFTDGRLSLCPRNGALIAADTRGNLSGGFIIETLSLGGRMAGPAAQPARLSSRRITGAFGGTTSASSLSLAAAAPTLTVEMAEDRTLSLVMQSLTAEAHIADSWRIEGVFDSGGLSDPSLPGSVSAIAGQWSAAPEDGAAVIRVSAAEALLVANRPDSDAERPLFNPIRLNNVAAMLRDGRVTADGEIILEETAQQIAQFTAEHRMNEGAGVARISAPGLTFDANLQPHDISERARGMVANVAGPASASADITWTRDDLHASGRIALQGVSLATATLPMIQGVRGEVVFDDFFALTTPPGQQLNIDAINPGITVRDGHVRFQLLADQRIAIEEAEFAFASGVLAMSPTTIALGEDETRLELTLRDVDAARLIAELELPDLAATGELEGAFPLRLTRRSAYVENGLLRAAAGGGLISYTGQAGESATGPARIAFDALRSFRYDNLSLSLNGDLSGELVSEINFSGVNDGRAVDLGPVAPGIGNVSVRGVPFVFNVSVTAPFRRLAETAATIVDPGSILDRTRPLPEEPETPEQLDPSPAGS